MKINVFASVTFGCVVLLTGCGGSSEGGFETIDYLPVQQEKDGKWSFVGPDGKLKYEDEFKNAPSAVVNGYFSIKEGEGYTLYKAVGKPEPVENCENLRAVGFMEEGLVPVVREKSRITLVDGSGKDKFTLQPFKGKEITWCHSGYVDGMLQVQIETGEYGFVNTKGEVVVQPIYNQASNFSEGVAMVQKDDQWLLIDKKGEEVLKIKKDWTPKRNLWSITYESPIEMHDGVIVIEDSNDHILFVNKKGESEKCPAKVKSVGDYNSMVYVFSDGDGMGVMKRGSNEVVVRPKYSNVWLMEDGRFLCEDDKNSYILNSKGDIKETLDEYKEVYPLGKFGIGVSEKNTILLLDKNGQPRKGCEYRTIELRCSIVSVYSDYFNVEGMANAVLEKLSANGYGNVKLGAYPKSFLTGPSNYTSRSTAIIDDLSGKGYRYTYSVKANFTGIIANSDYEILYNPYDIRFKYNWNDVKVNGIGINVKAESSLGEKGVKAVVKALEAKGFALDSSKYAYDGGVALLISKDKQSVVFVSCESKSTALNVMLTKMPSEEELQEFKKNYIDGFQGDKDAVDKVASNNEEPISVIEPVEATEEVEPAAAEGPVEWVEVTE